MAYFRSSDTTVRPKGLDVLDGVTLDDDDWQKLVTVMPVQYQKYFKRTQE